MVGDVVEKSKRRLPVNNRVSQFLTLLVRTVCMATMLKMMVANDVSRYIKSGLHLRVPRAMQFPGQCKAERQAGLHAQPGLCKFLGYALL